MKIKIILIALSFAVGILTASCADTTPLQRSSHSPQVMQKNMSVSPKIRALFKQDTFKFRSAEWFAGGDPLEADVTVRRILPQVMSVSFKFDEALNPMQWRNPSMLNYFTFCFAAVHSQVAGYSKWVIGGDPDSDFNLSKSTELTSNVAAIDSEADVSALPSHGPDGKRIEWVKDLITDNDANPEFCRKFLHPEIFK